MDKIKNHIVEILVFLILSTIYLYNLPGTVNFHPDLARDLYDILTLIQGKITLIGPKLSFGGYFSGPYYYYLFAPVLYIFRTNLDSVIWFNSLLFLGSFLYFFILVKRHYSGVLTSLAVVIVGLLPMFLLYSRGPWNGATYLPLLLIVSTTLFLDDVEQRRKLFILGLLSGIIINFHFITAIIFFFVFLYVAIVTKRKINIIYFTLGIVLTFTPLILFEVKHNFIMFKNTFITKSYLAFVENKNIPGAIAGKKNFFENMIFLSKNMGSLLGLNPFIYLLIAALGSFKIKNRKLTILTIFSCLSFLLTALLTRFQFGVHYLLPIGFFIFFTMLLVLLKGRQYILLIFILLAELYFFPRNIYKEATRKPAKYEQVVNYVIDHHLVRKNDSFNVLQISKDFNTLVPIGHEYRFFFRKNHIIPQSEHEYGSSDILLIFSEIPDFNISKLDNWEINQFGRETIKQAQKYKVDNTIIYTLRK